MAFDPERWFSEHLRLYERGGEYRDWACYRWNRRRIQEALSRLRVGRAKAVIAVAERRSEAHRAQYRNTLDGPVWSGPVEGQLATLLFEGRWWMEHTWEKKERRRKKRRAAKAG